MKRRQFVTSVASRVAANSGATSARAQAQECREHPNPATFVLIPGAWHGGWCYERTADLLRDRGHAVYSPSLTGVADRRHLLSPDVNMTTHIPDVVNLVEADVPQDDA